MEECPCVLRCLKSEDRPRHDTTPELMSAIVSSGVVSCRGRSRSEEHTSELQSHHDLVCRLLLEKKKAVHRQMVLAAEVAGGRGGKTEPGHVGKGDADEARRGVRNHAELWRQGADGASTCAVEWR